MNLNLNTVLPIQCLLDELERIEYIYRKDDLDLSKEEYLNFYFLREQYCFRIAKYFESQAEFSKQESVRYE